MPQVWLYATRHAVAVSVVALGEEAACCAMLPRGDTSVGGKFDSPLRYPGGKAALAPFLAKTIAMNDLDGCACYEPFACGAGAAARYGLCRVGGAQELLIAPEHLQLPTPDFREDALAWTT